MIFFIYIFQCVTPICRKVIYVMLVSCRNIIIICNSKGCAKTHCFVPQNDTPIYSMAFKKISKKTQKKVTKKSDKSDKCQFVTFLPIF